MTPKFRTLEEMWLHPMVFLDCTMSLGTKTDVSEQFRTIQNPPVGFVEDGNQCLLGLTVAEYTQTINSGSHPLDLVQNLHLLLIQG
jgi:inosine-uridine nucleoside N-ribohydrolase